MDKIEYLWILINISSLQIAPDLEHILALGYNSTQTRGQFDQHQGGALTFRLATELQQHIYHRYAARPPRYDRVNMLSSANYPSWVYL